MSESESPQQDETHHDQDDEPADQTTNERVESEESSSDEDDGWIDGDHENDPYAGMIIDDDTEQQPEPEPAPEPEPESASESEPEPMPEPVHAATGATTVTAVTKDGVTARPRGRPPTGKEWDYKLGAFVDSGTAKVSKKPLEKPVAANGAKRTNTGLESEEATPPADTKAAEAAAAAMLGPASVFIPEPAVSLPVQPATEERPKGSPFAAADETALMTRADDTAPPPPVSPSAQSELGEMTNTETNTQVEAIAAAQPDLDSPAVAETARPAVALAIPPLESEPEPEPNPEVPKPAPGTKLGLDVPNPVPVPGRSPTMTDLESFFGSLSLPVSRVAALADKLGIRGASDFKEFSEHELVEEYGFEADHIRKIFGALGPEEPRAPLSLVECKTCTQGSHHAHTCGRGKSQSRSRGHRSLPVQASTDSMAASSDPPEPVPAAASMQRSPTSKAQREAGALPFDHPGPKSKLFENDISDRERKKLARLEMQNPSATLKSRDLEKSLMQSKLGLHRPDAFRVLDDFEVRSPDWIKRGGKQQKSDERWHYFLLCPNEPYFTEERKLTMSWWEHSDDCTPYHDAIAAYEKPKLPFPDIISPEPTKIVCTKRMDGEPYYRVHRSKQFRDTWEDVTFPTKYPALFNVFQQRMAEEAAGGLDAPATPVSKPKPKLAAAAAVLPAASAEDLIILPPTSRKIVKKASNQANKKVAKEKKAKESTAVRSTADDFLNSATTPSLAAKPPRWWIGKRVRVRFEEGLYDGTVKKYVPNREGGAGNPFWVVYDDGDELWEKIPSEMIHFDNRGGHSLPRKLVDKDSASDSDDEALSAISARLPPATSKPKLRTSAPRAQIPKPQAAKPQVPKPKAQPAKPKAQSSAIRYSTGGAVIRQKSNGKAPAVVLKSSSSSSDDDTPLNFAARSEPAAKPSAVSKPAGRSKSSLFGSALKPVIAVKPAAAPRRRPTSIATATPSHSDKREVSKVEVAAESSSDDDVPIVKKQPPSKSGPSAKRPRESTMVIDSDSDDEGAVKSRSRNGKARKTDVAFSSDDNLTPDDFENYSFDEDNVSDGESGLKQAHTVHAINATRTPYQSQSSKRRNQVKSPSPNKGGGLQKIETFEITMINRKTNESRTFVTAQDAALALNLDQKSVKNLQTLAKKSKATKAVVVNPNWKAVRASLAAVKLPKDMARMVRHDAKRNDAKRKSFKIDQLAAHDPVSGLIAAQWQSWFSTPTQFRAYHIDCIHAVRNTVLDTCCMQKKNQWFPTGEMPIEPSYYQFLSFSHSEADQALLGSILENGLSAGNDNRTAAGVTKADKSHPSVWKDLTQGGVLTHKHLDTSIKTVPSYGESTGVFLIMKCVTSPPDKAKRFPTRDSLDSYDLGSGAIERFEIKPSAFKKDEDGKILYTSYQRDEDCTCHLDFDGSNKKFPYRSPVRQCVPFAVVSYFYGDKARDNTLMQRQRIETSSNVLRKIAEAQSSQRGKPGKAAIASRSLRPQATSKFANLKDNRREGLASPMRGYQRDTPASAYAPVQMSPASDDEVEIVPIASPTPSIDHFGGSSSFDNHLRSEAPQPSVSTARPKIKNLKDRPNKNPMGNHLKYSQAAVPPPPPLGPSDEPTIDSFDSTMETEFEAAPRALPPIPDIGVKVHKRPSTGLASGRSTPKSELRAQRCTLIPKQIPVQFRRNKTFSFHTMTLRALAPSREVRIPIIDERRGARAEFHAWKDEKTIREKAFKDRRTGELSHRSAMVEVSFDPDESMPVQEESERVKSLKVLERDLRKDGKEFGSMCILQGHSLSKSKQMRLYLLPSNSKIIAEMYSLYSDDTQRNRDNESWMGLLWWGNDIKDMSLGTYVESMQSKRPNKRKPVQGGGDARDPRKRQAAPLAKYEWNGLEMRFNEAVAEIEGTVILAGQTLERRDNLADLEDYLSEKNRRIEVTKATHEVAMLDMLKPASAMSMLQPMQLIKINAESAIKNRIMSLQSPNGQALLQDAVNSATYQQQWGMPELPESGTSWDTPRDYRRTSNRR